MASLVEEAPTAFALNPEVLRDGLLLVRSELLFPGPGRKLRHQERENSGLPGGTPFLLAGATAKCPPSSHPPHLPGCSPDRKGVSSCTFPGAGFG